MKTFFLLLLVTTVIEAIAQKQAVINGTITGLKDGTKVFLVPENFNEWRDSTLVRNSRFQFKLHVPLPAGNIYSIRLTKRGEKGKAKDFYIDEGIINIYGRNGVFNDVKVAGSQYARDFNDYNLFVEENFVVKGINKGIDKLSKEESKAANKKDSIAVNKIGDEIFLQMHKRDSVQFLLSKQWVEAHLNSAVSSYAVYTKMQRNLSIEELETVLNKLSPQAKNNDISKELQHSVEASKATAIGKVAPDFTQTDTAGHSVSLKDFRGKYVLIDFWASWCVPCRGENPNVVAQFNKYKDKKFTVLSVSLDKDRDEWLQAIRKDSLTWTHISDLKWWDNAVAKRYDIHSVPYNLLLNPDGKIIAKDLRGEELNKKLAEVFQ